MHRLRLLAIPLFLVIVLLLPSSPRVSAQGCTTVPVFTGATNWVASENGISNPDGYQFRQISGENDSIDMQRWNGSSWSASFGLLQTSFTTITGSADFRLVNNADDAAFEYCPPVVATPTSTSTPTEVIVTVTPSPTPTIVPWIALQERTDQTFSLQIFGFTIMLGIAIYFFLRLR